MVMCAEDHPARRGGLPVAAKALHRSADADIPLRVAIVRKRQVQPLEPGRRDMVRRARVEVSNSGSGVGGDDVTQIDRAAFELGLGRGGAVGDALHLFADLVIKAA